MGEFSLPEDIDQERPMRMRRSDGNKTITKHEYYWILAKSTVSGKSVILGPYEDEQEANQVGFAKLGGDFEIIPLRTRDSNRASHILKYRRFHQTAQLEEALKRAVHEKGLDRENRE